MHAFFLFNHSFLNVYMCEQCVSIYSVIEQVQSTLFCEAKHSVVIESVNHHATM